MPAPESRPSTVLPVVPRAVSRNSGTVEVQRTGGSNAARRGYRREAPSFRSDMREQRWEKPPPPQPVCHEEHVRRFDEQTSGHQVEGCDIPNNKFSGPAYGDRRNLEVGSEPPSETDMFGPMAPCWRLLERAQAYMDEVCSMTFNRKSKLSTRVLECILRRTPSRSCVVFLHRRCHFLDTKRTYNVDYLDALTTRVKIVSSGESHRSCRAGDLVVRLPLSPCSFRPPSKTYRISLST